MTGKQPSEPLPTEEEKAELKKLEERCGLTLDEAIAIMRNASPSKSEGNEMSALMLVGCALKWGLLSEESVREIFKGREPAEPN